jgi:hypothetical protein
MHVHRISSRRLRAPRRALAVAGMTALVAGVVPAAALADDDPRIGLAPGYHDAGQAISNLEKLASVPRVPPMDAPPGNFGFVNSDLAITGDYAIVGNFNGFQIYDISDPADPTLRTSFVCPGGQGDPSVYGDLLFISVEENRGRIDCGTQGAPGAVNPDRFRGVRIFDISDIDHPVQLPGVQTCRGSHTHTLVEDPNDPSTIYVYNSGTAGVRSADELAGCQNAALTTSPVTEGDPTQWRIDVIAVPLDAPQNATIVSQPRIFTDPATGAFNGLNNTLPGALHPSGAPYGPTPNTNTCHDITAFPAKQLVAGACQGDGILLDSSDPVNPVRLDNVSDPNFSYWHSATFNNDGTKVLFTDEWGGGTSARCRVTDQPEWGADALFDIVDNKMEFGSYYKLPVPQTTQENCVAHNGSIIPVPGRDIMVQAWYQGGLSIIDFTDTSNPVEIAYFDRGPINTPNPTGLNLGGFWSTYWYNGHIFGTEIARGFEAFALTPSEHMSQNEIDAASEVVLDQFNAQLQPMLTWEPSFNVVGSYYDQAVRSGALAGDLAKELGDNLRNAENLAGGPQNRAAIALLENVVRRAGEAGLDDLSQAAADLLDTIR